MAILGSLLIKLWMPVEAPLEFIPAPVNTVRFQELETGRDQANGKASLLQMVFGLHIMPVDCQRFEKVWTQTLLKTLIP
jgi:hypothetical protein